MPVLFLTAQDDAGDKLRGFEAEAVDYINRAAHGKSNQEVAIILNKTSRWAPTLARWPRCKRRRSSN